MQILTKKTVEKLLKSTSHALSVEDFDDIERLDRMAEKVAKITPEERRLLNQPFNLCGVDFYPITVAKSLWYEEKIKEWSVEGVFQDVFLFWLLTIPLDDESLSKFTKRSQVEKEVSRFSKKLHCTPAEMTDIFKLCIGKSTDKDGEPSDCSTNWGAVIACIVREYGGSPALWMYETPIEQLAVMMDQYVSRINAETESARKTSAKKGKAVAPVRSPKLVALSEFQKQAKRIEKKWSVLDGN